MIELQKGRNNNKNIYKLIIKLMLVVAWDN